LPMSLMMTTRGWPVKSSTCVGGSGSEKDTSTVAQNADNTKSAPAVMFFIAIPVHRERTTILNQEAAGAPADEDNQKGGKSANSQPSTI